MTPQINSRLSGSTAITAILQDNGILTVANVGDSRCILGRVSGDKLRVAALNTDHTPEVPEEADRILANEVSHLLSAEDLNALCTRSKNFLPAARALPCHSSSRLVSLLDQSPMSLQLLVS